MRHPVSAPSNRRLPARRLLLGGLLGAAAFAGAATPAAAATFSKTLAYTCTWPYVGDQPLSFTLNATNPYVVGSAGGVTYVYDGTVVAGGYTSVMVGLIGAATVEGSVAVKSTVTTTEGSTAWSYPMPVPQQAVSDEPADFVFTGNGSRQPRFVGSPPTITIDGIGPALLFRDVDGVIIDLPAGEGPQVDVDLGREIRPSCTLAPGSQDTRLTSAPLPTPSPDPEATPSPEPTGTPEPLPSPTPSPVVTPGPGPSPTPVVSPTPAPTPLPTNGSTPVPSPTPTMGNDMPIAYSYALAGSASLKTLTKGSLPLSGRIDAKLSVPSGAFTGDLTLAPSTGNLTALGFLPVVAKVDLVPTEPVTGALKGGKLTAVAKVRIKLPSVKTLGIELAGGANCQAKQISSISLASTQTTFLPLSGGPLAGSFSISDLSGCGFLTGIVSPLTKGSGNTIALNLTPTPPR